MCSPCSAFRERGAANKGEKGQKARGTTSLKEKEKGGTLCSPRSSRARCCTPCWAAAAGCSRTWQAAAGGGDVWESVCEREMGERQRERWARGRKRERRRKREKESVGGSVGWWVWWEPLFDNLPFSFPYHVRNARAADAGTDQQDRAEAKGGARHRQSRLASTAS